MIFGFAATYGFKSISDAVQFASDNDFKAVEINLNIPEFFPEYYSKNDIEKIRKMSKEYNVLLTFHAPEDINLCSKQKCIVETSIKRLEECIDFACALGGMRFTFHIGDSVNFTMFDRNLRMEDYYKDDYVNIMENSIEKLIGYTSKRIILCAENTGYFSSAKMESIEYGLKEGLSLTWDMGHSFIKKGQQEFMIKNIEYVRNAHIHDVHDGKDHCIIGTGEVDIMKQISMLDEKKVMFIIEVRPGEAAAESYRNIKKMMH